MSPAQLQERRNKGLCYNCNDKYNSGYCCKKLFIIEKCLEEGDRDIVMDEDDQIAEISEVSHHVISGTRAPETMQVKGSLGHVAVSVLVDAGITHNFVSEKLAKKVGLRPLLSGRFKVVVASGEKLVRPGKCTNVQLNLQGVPIYVDF